MGGANGAALVSFPPAAQCLRFDHRRESPGAMGKLQAQIDKDKKAIGYGLSVSDLSPLTDQEKLQKTMQELERAVGRRR
ncbi:hypothetical protein CEJ63_25690, partial [Acinetobacter baumannii]